MTASNWFLAFAIFSSVVTLVSSVPVRRPLPFLIFPVFILGILTTELGWFFLGLQLFIAFLFFALGDISTTSASIGLVLLALSWLGMWRLHFKAHAADDILRRALQHSLGTDYRTAIPPDRHHLLRDVIYRREWLRPLSMGHDSVERLEDIAYGDAGERNLLDIYRPRQPREGGCPVLLQVHGGGWYMGHKQQQALPLMYHMAQRGWLVVSINYRLSPTDTFPAHIIDVKKAIHWVRQNISEYGGNADFIAITGGSAGGHLTALAALTANDPVFQPGFEQADTSVNAAVPLYGVYDFLDHSGENYNAALRGFLEEKVMPALPNENPALWQQGSPVARVHEKAPPFFVIHGDIDVMTSWIEARHFVAALQGVSTQPVVHAELPGCQHGFDGMHSVRTCYTVNHIAEFLEWAHATAK